MKKRRIVKNKLSVGPPMVLSEQLTRRLGGYALAATAAGVATLACVMPAEGTAICKSVDYDLFATATYPINPAGQFAAPFNVAQTTYTYFHSTTGISHFSWWNRGFFTPNSANAKLLLGSQSLPANLATGASIGPGANFGKGVSYGLLFTYGSGTLNDRGHGTLKKHRGNFNLLQSNYVGFQFNQAGLVHYGWSRLKVDLIPVKGYISYKRSRIRVLGYGYETSPNTAIAAGACNADAVQTDDTSHPQINHDGKDNQSKKAATSGTQPVMLGLLAMGSEGQSLLREGD